MRRHRGAYATHIFKSGGSRLRQPDQYKYLHIWYDICLHVYYVHSCVGCSYGYHGRIFRFSAASRYMNYSCINHRRQIHHSDNTEY